MATIQPPTPDQIKQARTDAGLIQTEASETIYCSIGAWKKWESGERKMHPAFWKLFLIETKQAHNAELTGRGGDHLLVRH